MTALERAPNIGPTLARELRQVGVRDLDELRALGAVEAWERLRLAGLRTCAHSLRALEGAIQGIDWMTMPEADRARLTTHAAARRDTP